MDHRLARQIQFCTWFHDVTVWSRLILKMWTLFTKLLRRPWIWNKNRKGNKHSADQVPSVDWETTESTDQLLFIPKSSAMLVWWGTVTVQWLNDQTSNLANQPETQVHVKLWNLIMWLRNIVDHKPNSLSEENPSGSQCSSGEEISHSYPVWSICDSDPQHCGWLSSVL